MTVTSAAIAAMKFICGTCNCMVMMLERRTVQKRARAIARVSGHVLSYTNSNGELFFLEKVRLESDASKNPRMHAGLQ